MFPRHTEVLKSRRLLSEVFCTSSFVTLPLNAKRSSMPDKPIYSHTIPLRIPASYKIVRKSDRNLTHPSDKQNVMSLSAGVICII